MAEAARNAVYLPDRFENNVYHGWWMDYLLPRFLMFAYEPILFEERRTEHRFEQFTESCFAWSSTLPLPTSAARSIDAVLKWAVPKVKQTAENRLTKQHLPTRLLFRGVNWFYFLAHGFLLYALGALSTLLPHPKSLLSQNLTDSLRNSPQGTWTSDQEIWGLLSCIGLLILYKILKPNKNQMLSSYRTIDPRNDRSIHEPTGFAVHVHSENDVQDDAQQVDERHSEISDSSESESAESEEESIRDHDGTQNDLSWWQTQYTEAFVRIDHFPTNTFPADWFQKPQRTFIPKKWELFGSVHYAQMSSRICTSLFYAKHPDFSFILLANLLNNVFCSALITLVIMRPLAVPAIAVLQVLFDAVPSILMHNFWFWRTFCITCLVTSQFWLYLRIFPENIIYLKQTFLCTFCNVTLFIYFMSYAFEDAYSQSMLTSAQWMLFCTLLGCST